jgi:hypothetical protein
MNKYLLSDGSSTDNPNLEILDRFGVRMRLSNTEIPHSNNNGLKKTYDGMSSAGIMDAIQFNALQIAKSISNQINILGVEIVPGGFRLNVRINSVPYAVDISN